MLARLDEIGKPLPVREGISCLTSGLEWEFANRNEMEPYVSW
jgi:hypothetical protein